MSAFGKALDVGVSAFTEYVSQNASMSQTSKIHEKETGLAREMHELEVKISWEQHEREMQAAMKFHEAELKIAKDFHVKETFLNKQIHLMSTVSELERHFAQLDADLVNASKESERDMYDQRNQQLQTLILASTVIMAALSTLLIQGIMPQGSDSTVLIFFGATNGLSLSLLFICLVLCIETLRLASSFMVNRAESMNLEATQARRVVQEMFKELRETAPVKSFGSDEAAGGGKRKQRGPPGHELKKDNSSFFSMVDVVGPEKDIENSGIRLEEFWKQIEVLQHNKLQKRLKMNDAFYTQTETFEEFWNRSCKFSADMAIYSFYCGTGFFLAATIFWVWSEFGINYLSQNGAIACIVPIILSMPVGIYIKINLNKAEGKLIKENITKMQSRKAQNEVGEGDFNYNNLPGSQFVPFAQCAPVKVASPKYASNRSNV